MTAPSYAPVYGTLTETHLMYMRPEFIFHRPHRQPSHQEQRLFASFDHLIDNLGSFATDTGETAEEMLTDIAGTVGPAGAVALLHWSVLVANAKDRRSVTMDDTVAACLAAVAFSENVPLAKEGADIRLLGFIVQSAEYIKRHCQNVRVAVLADLCVQHIRVITEANAGNVVYRDPYLLVSWRSLFGTQKPELYVCVRNKVTGLFMFIPQVVMGGTNIVPPLSSFRAARHAIANWKGQPLTGELVGSSAIRLCKLLGIQVQGDKGIIHRSRR